MRKGQVCTIDVSYYALHHHPVFANAIATEFVSRRRDQNLKISAGREAENSQLRQHRCVVLASVRLIKGPFLCLTPTPSSTVSLPVSTTNPLLVIVLVSAAECGADVDFIIADSIFLRLCLSIRSPSFFNNDRGLHRFHLGITDYFRFRSFRQRIFFHHLSRHSAVPNPKQL